MITINQYNETYKKSENNVGTVHSCYNISLVIFGGISFLFIMLELEIIFYVTYFKLLHLQKKKIKPHKINYFKVIDSLL